jgi:PAS domain S-box-containing protein
MASTSQKYHALIELAPDPIFLINLSSRSIGEVNTKAAELLGYEQSTLEGMDVTGLHPPDRIEDYRSLFEETVESGLLRASTLPDGSQIYIRTREGNHIPVELHAKTVDVEGETWVYTIARDVTQRNERERQINQEKERLEKFAQVVSHDLRNPLNVANGEITLAREDCESEHLEEVARALERMERLIEDLLELASEGTLEPEWIDLNTVTRVCWQNVDTDETTINYDVDKPILADRTRLQQLFENLLRNAVEHGGEDVTITVGELDDGFYVEDDGPGIPASDRERVSDVGYSSTDEGTGFGLDIVKQVVSEHGWDVRVTAASTGGARFEITGVETK